MTDGMINEANLGERQSALSSPSIWRLVSRQIVPIVPFNETGSGPAIYCVHPVAGDVSRYRGLAKALYPSQKFFGIQVPGSKMNPEFCSSVKEVARHHVDALCRFQPHGPLILAGWSAGAIIALEMAQQLSAAGRDVPLLIPLDGAPSNAGSGRRGWDPLYIWQLCCNIPRWLRFEIHESSSILTFIRQMSKRTKSRLQMVFYPSRRAQSKQTSAAETVSGVLARQGWESQQRRFIQGLYEACCAYVPTPYSGRVLSYEAKVEPLGRPAQVGAAWVKIASHAEIVRIDGNHSTMLHSPNVDILAEHLSARLVELRSILYQDGPATRTAFCGSESEASRAVSLEMPGVADRSDSPLDAAGAAADLQ